MQTAFFYLIQLLPRSETERRLKEAINQSHSKKGTDIVAKNINAVHLTGKALEKIDLQQEIDIISPYCPATVSHDAPDFVKTVNAAMIADLGDTLPMSAFPPLMAAGQSVPQNRKNEISPQPSLVGKQTFARNVIIVLRPAPMSLFTQKSLQLRY